MNEKVRVWVTKYCLSDGIEELEVMSSSIDRETVSHGIGMNQRYFHEGDWFPTREEALAKAETMRTKRIASLKKQIAKLEKMSFQK